MAMYDAQVGHGGGYPYRSFRHARRSRSQGGGHARARRIATSSPSHGSHAPPPTVDAGKSLGWTIAGVSTIGLVGLGVYLYNAAEDDKEKRPARREAFAG